MIGNTLDKIGEEATAQVTHAYAIIAGILKADDDDEKQKIEQIVAAYQTAYWKTLAIDMTPHFKESASASAFDALKSLHDPNDTIDGFQATISANIELRGVFEQVNQEAVDFAQDRAAEMVGMKNVDGVLIENPNAKWRIDEPTRNWIREAVTEAFEDGMSPAELGKRLRSDYAFSKARARMIAFTETGNINMRTHERTAREVGANYKRSFLSADHDFDDFCDAAEQAGEVPIDYDYGMGLTRPLYHPRCKCSMTFYVREKEVAA